METNDNKLLMDEESFNKDELLSEMFDSYDDYCNYIIAQSIKKLNESLQP